MSVTHHSTLGVEGLVVAPGTCWQAGREQCSAVSLSVPRSWMLKDLVTSCQVKTSPVYW